MLITPARNGVEAAARVEVRRRAVVTMMGRGGLDASFKIEAVMN